MEVNIFLFVMTVSSELKDFCLKVKPQVKQLSRKSVIINYPHDPS